MKAFLLAAGYGTRLRPLTDSLPKPLVPVLGIPSICYAVALLKEAGISEGICNVHYMPQKVIEFIEGNSCFGMNFEFSVEKEILGTGGGVKKCEALLRGEDTVLINSDIISDLDCAEMLRVHKGNSSPCTVALYDTVEGPVSLKGGEVTDFKNFLGTGIPGTHEYMGAAVFNDEIFPFLEQEFSSIVYTGYTGLIQKASVEYYEHRGFWMDIGTVENLKRAESFLKKEKAFLERVEGHTGFRAVF